MRILCNTAPRVWATKFQGLLRRPDPLGTEARKRTSLSSTVKTYAPRNQAFSYLRYRRPGTPCQDICKNSYLRRFIPRLPSRIEYKH